MKGVIIPTETYKEMHLKHASGKSLRELATEYKLRLATIFYGFQRLGLEVYKATNEQRKRCKVQEDWFSEIDCQEKAYYLGLLMSDGYINKRLKGGKSARVCIKLHKTDSYLIQQFVDFVQPGASLYSEKNSLSCQIPSNQMVQDLEKLGLVERKTIHGEGFPILEEQFMFHFIRGYFDGDGSISLGGEPRNRSTIYICCANRAFLDQMQEYLVNHSIKATVHIETRGHLGYRDMYTLHINDRQRFYAKLYKDASIFMFRKKLKYDHVNTVLTRKNWQRRA